VGCGEGKGKWVCGPKMGSGRRRFGGGKGEETGGFHGGGGRVEESTSVCFCGLSYHHQRAQWMMETKWRVKICKRVIPRG